MTDRSISYLKLTEAASEAELEICEREIAKPYVLIENHDDHEGLSFDD